MNLRPISEAKTDRPVLAYFNDGRPPDERFIVMRYDKSSGIWYTIPEKRFTGWPTHFTDLPSDPEV